MSQVDPERLKLSIVTENAVKHMSLLVDTLDDRDRHSDAAKCARNALQAARACQRALLKEQ